MTDLVSFVLVGWVVLGVALFACIPPHRAVLVIFVGGILFLPEVQFPSFRPTDPQPLGFPGVKLIKLNALNYAVLLGGLLLDHARWLRFRPRWFDLPMLFWSCCCPLLTAAANDLDLYDSLAQCVSQFQSWGFPYLVGRIYFDTPARIRELACGFVVGGLLYVPLCLFEFQLAPQLHQWVYGFEQHDWWQAVRGVGYRPLVFMQHGLAVSFWMVTATLLAYGLWQSGPTGGTCDTRPRASFPWPLACAILLVISLLCQSFLALVLGLAGFVAAGLALRPRPGLGRAALAGLLLVAPLYVTLRCASGWTGDDLVAWLTDHFDPQRAQSLAFRLRTETQLLDRALERPWLGWCTWGRARTLAPFGGPVRVADSMWIITLGDWGFVGLAALFSALLLAPARLVLGRTITWSKGDRAVLTGAAIVITLYVLDGLMNFMLNPTFLLLAGGLTSVVGAAPGPVGAAKEPMPTFVRGRDMPRPGVLRRPLPVADSAWTGGPDAVPEV
jgi:hypothetical protein